MLLQVLQTFKNLHKARKIVFCHDQELLEGNTCTNSHTAVVTIYMQCGNVKVSKYQLCCAVQFCNIDDLHGKFQCFRKRPNIRRDKKSYLEHWPIPYLWLFKHTQSQVARGSVAKVP